MTFNKFEKLSVPKCNENWQRGCAHTHTCRHQSNYIERLRHKIAIRTFDFLMNDSFISWPFVIRNADVDHSIKIVKIVRDKNSSFYAIECANCNTNDVSITHSVVSILGLVFISIPLTLVSHLKMIFL